jgi:hypothetical protein
MIDTQKTLTGNNGFVQTPNTIIRLYTLLDGFDITTAGVYIFMRSWRNNDPSAEYHNCVWLSREEMAAQLGIGVDKLRVQIRKLTEYGLIEIRKSKSRANKDVFEVKEPLTEEQFREAYPDAIKKFESRLEEINARNKDDAEKFPAKKQQWKARQISSLDEKQSTGSPVVFSSDEIDDVEILHGWL